MSFICSRPCEGFPSVRVKVPVLSVIYKALQDLVLHPTPPLYLTLLQICSCLRICLLPVPSALEFSSPRHCIDQSLLFFRLLIKCHLPQLPYLKFQPCTLKCYFLTYFLSIFSDLFIFLITVYHYLTYSIFFSFFKD